MLGRMLGEDIELQLQLQPGLWSTVADQGQVEQVLVNLVVNARDAMPRGGRIELGTQDDSAGAPTAFPLDERKAGEWVRLLVRDSGVGMSPEVKAHLFEPFFTTKPAGLGTGLGLATVYGIVSQSGGHVHVESAPGRGSTFVVCLPRTPGAAAILPLEPAGDPRGGAETVLLVEDDRQVRGVVERALREAGYQVLAAASGAQALELVRGASGPPHLVVTDIVMPGMDGPTLARELRRLLPAIAVLFVSGYSEEAIERHGVLLAGAALLAKPFTTTALLSGVRGALDARRG